MLMISTFIGLCIPLLIVLLITLVHSNINKVTTILSQFKHIFLIINAKAILPLLLKNFLRKLHFTATKHKYKQTNKTNEVSDSITLTNLSSHSLSHKNNIKHVISDVTKVSSLELGRFIIRRNCDTWKTDRRGSGTN